MIILGYELDKKYNFNMQIIEIIQPIMVIALLGSASTGKKMNYDRSSDRRP